MAKHKIDQSLSIIYNHVDIVSLVEELKEKEKIRLKFINFFWNVFFATRRQLFIVCEWKIVIANPAFEKANKKAILGLKNKESVNCSDLTHPGKKCWWDDCPCPINLCKENSWDYSVWDHKHPNWTYEVGVIQIPNAILVSMQRKFSERLWSQSYAKHKNFTWKQFFLHTSKNVTKLRLLEKNAASSHDAEIRAQVAEESKQ